MNVSIESIIGGSYATGAGLTCAPIMVTKEIADSMLSQNFHNNRKAGRSNVVRFSNALRANEFLPGSPIRMCKSQEGYTLTDGQHRLMAVSETGIPAPFVLIVSPLTPDKDYILADQIATIRKIADNARALGMGADWSSTVANSFGAAVKLIHTGFSTDGLAMLSKTYVVNETGSQYVDAMELLLDWTVGIKGRSSTTRGIYKSGVLAVALLTAKHQPEKAREFWVKAVIDDGLTRDNPIKWMSDHLAKASSGKKGGANVGQKLISRVDSFVAAYCWNKFYGGAPMNMPAKMGKGASILDLGLDGTPLKKK